MVFDRAARLDLLATHAAGYLDVALANIVREYPHMPWFIAESETDYRTHRIYHPAFFGCLDWHSCVEMHWAMIRILRLFPDAAGADRVRRQLDDLLTDENLATEKAFMDANPGFERPYGRGWYLTLQHELATWDDADGQRWATILQPLADSIAEGLVAWLPKLPYPVRIGMHQNTAFGLSRALDFAARRADHGSPDLLDAIHSAARHWFLEDVDYPGNYEPSGSDFLSGGLCEAELVSSLLPTDEFSQWLGRFLPGISDREPRSLFSPATVTDHADGQIAHLEGLNLSRAWNFIRIAAALPEDDPRAAPLIDAAGYHAQASLGAVAGSDYMVEHWLAAYATLLLSS
ncbi:MAG TPA: DUF2891 domain-containing protein [Thermomicrobiales bacterium]|nr:DUF2891 domain-containing protein [Thermomicrobiales bacterium]